MDRLFYFGKKHKKKTLYLVPTFGVTTPRLRIYQKKVSKPQPKKEMTFALYNIILQKVINQLIYLLKSYYRAII